MQAEDNYIMLKYWICQSGRLVGSEAAAKRAGHTAEVVDVGKRKIFDWSVTVEADTDWKIAVQPFAPDWTVAVLAVLAVGTGPESHVVAVAFEVKFVETDALHTD